MLYVEMVDWVGNDENASPSALDRQTALSAEQ